MQKLSFEELNKIHMKLAESWSFFFNIINFFSIQIRLKKDRSQNLMSPEKKN